MHLTPLWNAAALRKPSHNTSRSTANAQANEQAEQIALLEYGQPTESNEASREDLLDSNNQDHSDNKNIPRSTHRKIRFPICCCLTWLSIGGLLLLLGVGITFDDYYDESSSHFNSTLTSNTTTYGKLESSLAHLWKDVKTSVESGLNWSRPILLKPIKISVQPRPRLASEDPDEKFIGFLTHSGYHNQRAELVNAIMIANMLNRTLLLPPIWMGWPSSWRPYDSLAQVWRNNVARNPQAFQLDDMFEANLSRSPLNWKPLDYTYSSRLYPWRGPTGRKRVFRRQEDNQQSEQNTEAECKSYSKSCRKTYQDTFMSWDSLLDLDKIPESIVRIVDRWDIRDKSLEADLRVTSGDIFVFDDVTRYEFQFSNTPPPLIRDVAATGNHDKPARQISIQALKELPQKVILFGTLYGEHRIEGRDAALKERLDRLTAFRSPWLMKPAKAIRSRLGGDYVGVHARIAEGHFAESAMSNMEDTWRALVKSMGIPSEVSQKMWERVKPVDEEASGWQEQNLTDANRHRRSQEFSFLRSLRILPRLALSHNPRASSKLHELDCRSTLHTESNMWQFNTPLYIATDAPHPESHAALSIFFKAFPCTFLLTDFDTPNSLNHYRAIESIADMYRLVNEADGIKMGRYFMPFLEAMVASMGSVTQGTNQSSFSAFAEKGLHDAYKNDPDSELPILSEDNEDWMM